MNDQAANSGRSPILVTGGTGTLGRLVVAGLLEAGRTVRVLSRGQRDRQAREGIEYVTADLATGDALDAAVQGIETIVHLAGSAKGDEDKTRNLLRAASRAKVRHVVYISVVGADRVPIRNAIDRAMFGYFGSKLAAEQAVVDSGLPWTIVRATQFQQSMLATVQQLAKLPLIPVPTGFRFQPIDAAEVATRLVELALGQPAGRVPDLAGPRDYAMADLVRGYLRAAGKRRLIVPAPAMGAAARAFRAGANLAPDRAVGQRTWEQLLAAQVEPPSAGPVAA
jgi:uncharacterized protein YbjT (DUF2867 family)